MYLSSFTKLLRYAVVATCFAGSLSALQPATYLNVEGGYRYDRITTRADAYAADEFFLGENKLKLKRLNIYEIGGCGQINLCDYWFLKGGGFYGWSQGGRFHEKVEDFLGNTVRSAAGVHKGRFRDASGAFGYMYPVDGWWGNWGIGPMVGYAFNDQRVHIGEVRTERVVNPTLQDVEYYNRWCGPWVGGDMVYQWCDWRFTTGFEWHFPRWHGWFKVKRDITGIVFSDTRRSSHTRGYVWYAKAEWEFWPNWHIGVNYRWQFWHVWNGRLKPMHKDGSFANVGFPIIDHVDIDNSRWYSDAYTVYVGADF